MEDLAQQRVELHEGLILTLYSDDLNTAGKLDEILVDGVVTFSTDQRCWVAAIDWSAIRHASDRERLQTDGNQESAASDGAAKGVEQ
jgi:hypothetical protein